eukprot:gene7254-12939_t
MGKFRSLRRSKRSFMANQHVKVNKDDVKFKAKCKGRPKKKETKVKEIRPVQLSLDSLPTTSGTVNPFVSSTPIQNRSAESGKSRSLTKISKARQNFKRLSEDINERCTTETGYRLIDMELISQAFKVLACPECLSCSLEVKDNHRAKNGFANKLSLTCQECFWSYEFFTSKIVKGSYEVNKRFAYAMRRTGNGYAGGKKFCAVMNIPTMPTKKNFMKLNSSLKSAVYDVAQESMKNAANEVKSIIGKDNTDCGVSVDGSWQKRGFVSLNGCVSAISMDTGKVVDVEPMSRHCKGCETHSSLDRNSITYQNWKEKHLCKANIHGSAAAMEPEGARRIFARSVQKHGICYTKFYGDGDSKGFHAVERIYEETGKPVEKLECIGHVQKRMGTALRKLKKETKGLGGKGKLTDKDVFELGVYDAVCHFNDGESATSQVLQHLGLEPGLFSNKFCNELDNSRIYSSGYRELDTTKLKRKGLRRKRKSKDDKIKEKEGDTYGPGQF